MRPNDLSSALDVEDEGSAPTQGQDPVTLRLAEAIYSVLDWLEHPTSEDPLDVTTQFARRCLIALGHTTLNAIEIEPSKGASVIRFGASEAMRSGAWLVLPVGARLSQEHADRARTLNPSFWFVCSGNRWRGATPYGQYNLVLREPEDADRLRRALAPLAVD